MYPHERSLVERFEGQPFALLGVNSDSTRERVKRAIEKNDLTWRSWFDGGSTNGPIATAWKVRAWPTLYLIDAKGVIRHQNLTGYKLERAIEELIREAKSHE